MLFFTLCGLALVFLGPPFAALSLPWHDRPLAALAGLVAWAGMAAAYGGPRP